MISAVDGVMQTSTGTATFRSVCDVGLELKTCKMTTSSTSSSSSPSERSHYVVLGVPNTATCDEIKKA